MRRLVLAATAIATFVAGTPALAATPLKFSYGANIAVMGANVDRSGAVASDDGFQSRSDTDLWFKTSTMFDNGIQFGFLSSLELEGADGAIPHRGHIDDVYIEMKGFFGKVQIGREDGIGKQMRLATPSPLNRAYTNDVRLDALEVANIYSELSLAGDRGKIVYLTPRIAGFQLGASYLVENAKFGAPVHVTTDFARGRSGAKQATEAGLNYTGKVGGVNLDAAATYYTDNHNGVGQRDPEGYNLGLAVGLDGWTVGGNLTQGNNINHATLYANNTKSTIWSAGLTYGNGPWLLGGAYSHGADDPAGANNDVDYQSYVLGLIYFLNPGVTLGLGWQHDKADPDPLGVITPTGGSTFALGQDVNGNAVFVETGLKF